MSKHTPGEWGVMNDSMRGRASPYEAAPGLTIGSTEHTEPICRVSGYLMPLEANANLIMAAPELLAACKETLANWPEEDEFGEPWDEQYATPAYRAYRDRLRAAVAKAEGK